MLFLAPASLSTDILRNVNYGNSKISTVVKEKVIDTTARWPTTGLGGPPMTGAMRRCKLEAVNFVRGCGVTAAARSWASRGGTSAHGDGRVPFRPVADVQCARTDNPSDRLPLVSCPQH